MFGCFIAVITGQMQPYRTYSVKTARQKYGH
jgi:hypothetical protein